MSSDFHTELYKDLHGPGSKETTRKAFSMLKNLPPKPVILDVGCGIGMTSIELAKLSNGNIIALDINPVFLEILQKHAKEQRVADKIKTINQDMCSMDFEENSFDVIWTENSVFFVGFERVLKEWRVFLKKGGYFVVSVLRKLKGNPPDEAKEYWKLVYPSVKTHEETLKFIENHGYQLISSFILPDADYNCYTLLEKRITALREKYRGNKQYIKELDLNQREIDIFRKYNSEYYGCVFYIMQN